MRVTYMYIRGVLRAFYVLKKKNCTSVFVDYCRTNVGRTTKVGREGIYEIS